MAREYLKQFSVDNMKKKMMMTSDTIRTRIHGMAYCVYALQCDQWPTVPLFSEDLQTATMAGSIFSTLDL